LEPSNYHLPGYLHWQESMRYGPFVGQKLAALKAATDSNYRFVMLFLMLVEIGLLFVLVALESLHR
jgi:hypothetical protein